jgi:DNA-binding response OmpR family regulator
VEAAHEIEVMVMGQLEVRPAELIALAAGRPLNLSVREFGLLVELSRRKDRIVAREQLFARVWGTELRDGDRSVDVYVHKLRAKLEEALPEWSFIHTHVGFGYRLSAEPSHPFHKGTTTR